MIILAMPSLLLAGKSFVSFIPMRDGVRLSTNVYLPDAGGPFPVLLVRTPYNKGTLLIASYRVFLDRGFAVVVQDVRGRYASGGTFGALAQELTDGDDTLNWIAKQRWSTGRIGMLGGSYVGMVQWRAALAGNPHLQAIFPAVSGSDEYRDRFYSRGGALKPGHRLLWLADNFRAPGYQRLPFFDFVNHLPLRTADRVAAGRTLDIWQQALNHPAYDAFWRSRSILERISAVRIPAFIVSGWYDNYVEGDLDAFVALRRQSRTHRILIGPWGHSMTEPFPSGITFGGKSSAPIRNIQLAWFDHWLRAPQPAPDFPQAPVRIFVMGANEWRDEQEWPLARTRLTPLYLASRLTARSLQGDGLLLSQPAQSDADTFTYNPRHPVPTVGGAICCNAGVFLPGPMDQRRVETRDDVLIYTSPPLKQDMEVTGEIHVVLYVSSSAPDTDFTAKLVDVSPDGFARNVCDGILRLRYREGLHKLKLAKPGERYQIDIPAGVTSNVFRSGHRIRLEVSSSNFPRFDRNPNTAEPIAEEKELHVANQTVFHGKATPSHILLPVIPSANSMRSGNRR